MNELSHHIGRRIRQFRRMQGLTLQQMAEQLNKSKATMSKYESGDIILDVETLSSIADLLQISISQLTDYRPEEKISPDYGIRHTDNTRVSPKETDQMTMNLMQPEQSPFFQANQLYFYYYDGRYRRLKQGSLRIHRTDPAALEHPVTAVISAGTPLGKQNEAYYIGTVTYSDMVIRFTFSNQQGGIEQNMLYLFNPPMLADAAHSREMESGEQHLLAEGLLSGLSIPDQIPCAFKCLVSLVPEDTNLTSPILQRLTFTRRELQRMQKLNMLLPDSQF